MKHTALKMLTLLCLTLSLLVSTAFVIGAEEAETPDASAVLSYAGMSARKSGDSGIRSTYTLDFSAAEALDSAGYTVEVGAIMGIAKIGETSHNTLSDLTVRKDAEKGYVAEKSQTAVPCFVHPAVQSCPTIDMMIDCIRQMLYAVFLCIARIRLG